MQDLWSLAKTNRLCYNLLHDRFEAIFQEHHFRQNLPMRIPFPRLTEECFGIPIDTPVISDWGQDQENPPEKVHDLLRLPFPLHRLCFQRRKRSEPRIEITFREAVRLYVREFNKIGFDEPGRHKNTWSQHALRFEGNRINHSLINAVTNINTPHPQLISFPAPACEAVQSGRDFMNEYWNGAILGLLIEKGSILNWGDRCGLWVKIPTPTEANAENTQNGTGK